MPSTYTTNLGIEKIATGEQSGTWGTTTNTNLDLIDQAVNGVEQVTLAAAGSSGSPNDLPITNGASSDGRNKFIEFVDGGDLGGTAYVQLTPNDAEKIVFIRNSLSAARNIIIFQGTYNASNDFEIPNGADVVLKFDGAGASATVTDVYVNLTPTKVTTANLVATSADINGGSIDGATLGTNSAVTEAQIDNININGNTISSTDTNGNITLAPNGSGVVALSSTDITFGDNDKAIFGAGSDLQIYHDGSGSYIDEVGTGPLKIRTDGFVGIYNTAETETIATFADDGAVRLYYDNGEKLATTATGIDVTGTVTADGLTVAQSNPTITITDTDGSTSTTLKTVGSNTELSNLSGGNLRFRTNASELERMRISPDGDISFYEDTGTTPKLFWDASAESLGIGTASPTQQLQLTGNALAGGWFRGAAGSASSPTFMVDGATGMYRASSNDIAFATASTERMRIDSSGSVNIGGTGGQSKFEVNNAVSTTGSLTDTTINLATTGVTGRKANIGFGLAGGVANTNAATIGFDVTNGAGALQGDLFFATRGSTADSVPTERMRIDSSGNLLVGKTASAGGTAGFEARSDGATLATRSGNRPLILNRLSDTGDLLLFQKDGADVGEIGTQAGDLYISNAVDVGIYFESSGTDHVAPCDIAGSKRDNAIDLGASAARFKDLYLSGGVYLGGTTSANYLDDYEEGTWTPAYSADTGTPTTASSSGLYRKIGKIVTVSFFISGAPNGASGTLRISGLPFASTTLSPGYGTGHCAIYGMTWSWTNPPASIFALSGASDLRMWDTGTNNQVVSDMSASGNNLECSVTYMTS